MTRVDDDAERYSGVVGRRTPGEAAFVNRVMALVGQEPRPTPIRAFASAIAALSASEALSAVLVAWHLGTARRPMIRLGLRARSLALVVIVIFALGSASLVAGAAVQAVARQVTNGIDAGQRGTDERNRVQNDQSRDSEQNADGQHGPTGTDQAAGSQGENGANGTDDPDSTAGEQGDGGPSGSNGDNNNDGANDPDESDGSVSP